MAVAWTDEQKKVIDLRDRNILVAAAAGSGKTAVLVERILSRITDPEDPVSVDELLSGKTAPAVTIVPEELRKDLKDLMLRVVVDTEKGDKVRVNLPMSLVQVALDMGLELPQLSGNEALKNIDLQQIVNLVRHGAVGNLVDVETSDGVTVHIFVE